VACRGFGPGEYAAGRLHHGKIVTGVHSKPLGSNRCLWMTRPALVDHAEIGVPTGASAPISA
jgi:hypothetical protein